MVGVHCSAFGQSSRFLRLRDSTGLAGGPASLLGLTGSRRFRRDFSTGRGNLRTRAAEVPSGARRHRIVQSRVAGRRRGFARRVTSARLARSSGRLGSRPSGVATFRCAPVSSRVRLRQWRNAPPREGACRPPDCPAAELATSVRSLGGRAFPLGDRLTLRSRPLQVKGASDAEGVRIPGPDSNRAGGVDTPRIDLCGRRDSRSIDGKSPAIRRRTDEPPPPHGVAR